MTIFLGASTLLVIWIVFCLYGHGYVNTVEWLAWILKVHARHVRRMHEMRRSELNERWNSEMKENGISVQM